MRVVLLGYGKTGKEIESCLKERKHDIRGIQTSSDRDVLSKVKSDIDVAIDFSRPDVVCDNIVKCFEYGIPIVVGTTGWYDKLENIKQQCEVTKGALLYATNFSIGVNIFFKLNMYLASIMNKYEDYTLSMEEIHHTAKLDAPSGTAITLAQKIAKQLTREYSDGNVDTDSIAYQRLDDVPGTHIIRYEGEVDSIMLEHKAKNRKGFALGSVLAAEWILGKTGVFTMEDVLHI